MEVNLKVAQDAGANSHSSAGKQASTVAASANESLKQAVKAKVKTVAKADIQAIRESQKPLSEEELRNVTSELTKFMQSMNADIHFSVHEKTGRMMVRVLDSNQQVLKEFPSHELLDTIAAISEYVGALLDRKI